MQATSVQYTDVTYAGNNNRSQFYGLPALRARFADDGSDESTLISSNATEFACKLNIDIFISVYL